MGKKILYAKKTIAAIAGILVFSLFLPFAVHAADPIIIDHTCTDINLIPEAAIEQAKSDLHIAYGHTSHGSQLISGMGSNSGASLDQFMTANGATPGLYLWNNGGSGGALDLHDYFVSGDLGNPDRYTWEQRTRDYLNTPANADVNVVIWSWCGQASTSIANIDIYLNLMEGLINDYPNVHFVFMTGHLTGTGSDGRLNLANEHIRNHCRTNNRILFDFADIESYDPDGLVNYMELSADDECYYDSDGNGSKESNWALDWQDSHIQNVDWWASGASHSQHLNGNRKGYAAWWLWATLAGWNTTVCGPDPSGLTAAANQDQTEISLSWSDNSADDNEAEFIIQRRDDSGTWNNDYARVAADTPQYIDINVQQGSFEYRVVASYSDSPEPCSSSASNIASVQISSEVPQDPSDLVANLANSGIDLSWSDNSNNEDGFVLERQTDTTGFIELIQLSSDTSSYLDNSVAAVHTYTYRVKAVNNYGDSGYSNEASEYVPDQTFSVTLKQNVDGYQGSTDTYLDAGNPDTNFGNTLYKSIGGTPQVNMAIKFDLPDNLMNKIIHSAKIVFYCWSVSNYVEDQEFKLCELTEGWDENTVTWEERETGVDWSVPGGEYCTLPVSTSPIENQSYYPEFDVTQLVQSWSDQSLTNNGLILINDSQILTGIKASEYSEYGRPSMEIQYSAISECTAGKDGDSDVDGLDLALFATEFDPDCLEMFAWEYGN